MNGLQKKNVKNLHFWAFCAKMVNLGQFFAKMGKRGNFQKSAWKKCLKALTAKFQKKAMNGFRDTASSTNGRESLGLQRLR